MPGITGRNGAHSGGLRSPIIIYHNPRQSGKAIHSYGTLAIDVCTGAICVHDGVTPGGCYCFHKPEPLCDQVAALPDFGDVCPTPPPPAPFDPCALMAALPDFGAVCVTPPPPPAYNPCLTAASLPDFGTVCATPPAPPAYNPCLTAASLPDFGAAC